MKYNPDSLNDRTKLATLIAAQLDGAGFKRIDANAGEDVYEYSLSEKIRVRVYSSIVNGMCRGLGEDAIRVVALYRRKDGKDQFLVNEARVFRTGEIIDISNRTLERARDVVRELIRRKNHGMVCAKCGAPTFLSKAGRETCAETCWVKE
jgi:predicted HNH restriction endonuclease